MLALGRGSVWTRDLDCTLTAEQLGSLGDCLGSGRIDAERTGLRPVIRRLGGSSALTPGLLRIGVYHRTRRRHGQQYCPACLVEDQTPYYRREWRMAFAFVCQRHGVGLQDACPACDGPVVAHRTPGLLLESCAHCGRSLADDGAEPARTALLDTQKTVCRHWNADGVPIGNEAVALPEWIAGVRILCHAAFRHGTRPSMAEALEEATGLTLPRPDRPEIFELSRTACRGPAVAAAVWLLDDWPRRFLAFARRLDLRLTEILDIARTRPPVWLERVLLQLPYDPLARPRRPRRKKTSSRRSLETARQKIAMAVAVRERLDTLGAERPS